MSIKVLVYVPELNKELLPEIAVRFADSGMECQFDPRFALDPAKNNGWVHVRLWVSASQVPQYQGVNLLASFEIAFKDFRYSGPLSVNPAVNEKLKACTQLVTIRMHAQPTNTLRAGMYFAGFLAEQADGIVYTPRTDKYLEPVQALEQIAQEVKTYETELPSQDWSFVPFDSWP